MVAWGSVVHAQRHPRLGAWLAVFLLMQNLPRQQLLNQAGSLGPARSRPGDFGLPGLCPRKACASGVAWCAFSRACAY